MISAYLITKPSINRFHFRQDEGAARSGHPLGIEHVLQDDLRVVLHVTGHDFQHQVDFTGYREDRNDPLDFSEVPGQFFPPYLGIAEEEIQAATKPSAGEVYFL